MTSSPSPKDERHCIDPAEPFKGIVVCCTSIPPEQRTDIANRVQELGGIHKYDLTPDATHLVVGDYDTPKYRHVARERQDVKAMDAAWIEAVSHLWKLDDEIDFPAARQSLLVCQTGFGDQRDEIADKITSNGGRYTGDLTRKCTHLIVSKPEGKKFTAAKSWNIYTVTLDWLYQSVERGMILEEAKFDPLLPLEQQGAGAWVRKDPRRTSLGKRSRSAVANRPEEGVRKLRKTASMKLNSQRNNLWGDILGRSTSRDYSFNESRRAEAPAQDALPPEPLPPQDEDGVYSNCVFAIHGFDQQRQKVLEETVATLSGIVSPTLEAVASGSMRGEALRRFLIVPQTSQPDTHPRILNDDVHIVTEFYIERCMHNKRFFPPSEHVLGRPFPMFPIRGFSDLTVCSAAFTGLELSQMARSVAQLGAKFEEGFRRSTSLVVCKSLQAMRKEKLRYALEWEVPVVSADWLWECISTGFNVPFEGYIFPEIRKQYISPKRPEVGEERGSSRPQQQRPLEPTLAIPRPSKARLPAEVGLDATAFDRDSPDKGGRRKAPRAVPQEDSTTSADFMTARTHPANTSPSPPKHVTGPTRTRSEPWPRSLVEKTTGLVRGPSAPPADPSRGAESDAEEAKRKAEEKARKQAREAERQVLSSKLSSLIHSTTTDADGREPRSQTAVARPRRRQVFGRAISNASNASSAASADGGRPAPESLRSVAAGGADNDVAAAESRQSASRTPPPPPATQLEYRDPQVLESKAALVSKMMMVASGDADGAGMAARPAAAASSEASGAGVGVYSGRALRKR
ncbi:twin BRCT domain-containing protein [Hirsutella rhossiliensis]|uniref:Twin BRCT domain-containing protein n=1 Tax=Hirsutella rhossiliensis TaxID=111463 RepID=A0A9P8MU15_9HYPO|nr:twin BRCT domain-containing protein [Hirsutella rhossiliensis]KAH0961397.1 twin BRCT domain-containing protein [Hirsutella rhossiliensis]